MSQRVRDVIRKQRSLIGILGACATELWLAYLVSRPIYPLIDSQWGFFSTVILVLLLGVCPAWAGCV